MCQTLFVIPEQIAGISMFGVGWLLGAWVLVSAVLIGWSVRQHGWGGETRGQIGATLIVALAIIFILPGVVDEELGGLAIRGYGVMLLVAVVSGIGLSTYRARRVGLDPEVILSLGTWFFVWGIAGARLFYVIQYWNRFLRPNPQNPELVPTLAAIVNLTDGGLVVYGALLAGGAALLLFIHKHRLPGLALSDLIAPGVVLGVGLGRLGCFMNGCCYGDLTDVPWAVQFPPGAKVPVYTDQIERGNLYLHGLLFKGYGDDPPVIAKVEPNSAAQRNGLEVGQRVAAVGGVKVRTVHEAQMELLRTFGEGQHVRIAIDGERAPKEWTVASPPPWSKPVHPAQLYSFIDALLLCLLVLAYEPFKRRDGELTALVLTLHPISRYLLEEIRIDEPARFGTPWSISQIISIGICLLGIAMWIHLLRKPKATIAWPKGLAAAA
ncbi:MAG: hypothetical protein DWQ37_21525 [Planctomycetota bacterium]|nr:MAG: hypothetical protein DWQ37_21525 [Planctomycetota bacterium]